MHPHLELGAPFWSPQLQEDLEELEAPDTGQDGPGSDPHVAAVMLSCLHARSGLVPREVTSNRPLLKAGSSLSDPPNTNVQGWMQGDAAVQLPLSPHALIAAPPKL